ncbi:tetratricopeptide repeat protein [Hoeflea prorocentri]|uniref:Tetratricopeptide repeat protein n=1 Tax=Hoeflea prorocentri TaxID=1922333 RepID=A0A9X3UGL3_9HYPH|nr:tetratricopeptide repeat protein [Hoeflea prorocentri]MCY6380291.1 tetratricopeptide repeat protein [Hoeflea prorocentri]MDA5398091.1 tetratricopeptide repeat protein [Hoeflea prorocentri]
MKAAILSTALLVSASLLMSTPGMTAGSGGGSSNNNTCNAGWVWDKNKKKCVRQSSEVDQESLYEAGRYLAHAGRYQEAIDVLKLASIDDDKRVLNYLGFATRKLGRVDEGLVYYQKALALDPEYTLVREYMGEALLQKGDLEGALEQLAEIRRLCNGRDCSEYGELSGMIAEYVKKAAS